MTRARILVVEDDRIVSRDIQEQLIRAGHTIVAAVGRADDAVAVAEGQRPDLVLMDICLDAGSDGVEAARQIGERCEIPVIYLTASADEATLSRASGTAPFGYLLKPFEDAQLRTAVEIALSKHAAETRQRESEQTAALRQAHARLQLALQGSSVGIWDVDMPDGNIENARLTFVNFWEQHGYDPDEEVTFEMLASRWHPDDRERVSHSVVSYLQGKTPEHEIVCRMLKKDGGAHWNLCRGVAVRDEAGKPIRFIGSAVDITDRVEIENALRQSEERFRNTFDNAAAGIVHLDIDSTRLLRINDRYCEMAGYTREDLLETCAVDIVHPDDRAGMLARFRALAREELSRYTAELRIIRKDGTSLWISVTVAKVHETSSAVPYAVGIIEDLSERKRLEEELRLAKEIAEAGNRAKDEFLANVSHEIRTPMNAILGMSGLVLDTSLSAEQQTLMRTVKSSASSLLAIIDDLLDFSKIEAGKLGLDVGGFSLRPVLADVMRALAPRAHLKGLELVSTVGADVPDGLEGDAGRLRQVLINLVGNAVKFTASGEVVVAVERLSVDAEASPRETTLRFSVRDTGIGIPREKQKTIFRAFEQEDTSTTRKYGGTGLGLTIATRLVEMMGGQITVESEPGRGSTFTFTVPLRSDVEMSAAHAGSPPAGLRGLRALIVDDNASTRRIVEEWLRGSGLEPTVAGDAGAAMDALFHGVATEQPYPLAVLDARMPHTDGFALAAKIKERAELADLRIILLTSGDAPADLERSRELGIDAHLLKPASQDELLEAIRQTMNRGAREVPSPLGAELLKVVTAEREPEIAPVPLRILVAEDNQVNAQLVQQMLLKRGHAVRLARNGREALAQTERGGFDLLLLDLHMPEVDGFQAITALREREKASGGRLPVIALTARSRPVDRVRSLAAGMDDFLTKPIDPAALWAAIDRVLPHASSEPSEPLIAPNVMLAACGGDANILDGICTALRAQLPEDLARLDRALKAQNAPQLREAAHSLSGTLASFSAEPGRVASELEEHAAGGRLVEAAALADRIRRMVPSLLHAIKHISIEGLRGGGGSRMTPSGMRLALGDGVGRQSGGGT